MIFSDICLEYMVEEGDYKGRDPMFLEWIVVFVYEETMQSGIDRGEGVMSHSEKGDSCLVMMA